MKKFRLNPWYAAALTVLAGQTLAAGIVATGTQTQVNNAGNAPVVNIAGANAAGISRNTFSSFDVDQRGVVLNNQTKAGVSQLAGQLAANANLAGTAAKVIVADVNSAQASKLNGTVEVAGAAAHVLIANAAGISADGFSTINAPVVSLAAARFNPRADSPLALSADVFNGDAVIRVDGAGIDVGSSELNLLSRATLVNAAVKGWAINSQNGTEFDGDGANGFTGKLVKNVFDPAHRRYSLDVSELGGMYANKIVLEGSEYGLGVNNAGIIKSGKQGTQIQMYGSAARGNGIAALTESGAGLTISDGIQQFVLSSTVASQKDGAREEYLRGLNEEEIFVASKQHNKELAESVARDLGWSAEADAVLSNTDKQAQVDQIVVSGKADQVVMLQQRVNAAAEKAEADALDRALYMPESARTPEQQALVDNYLAEQKRKQAEADAAHLTDPRYLEEVAARAAEVAAQAAAQAQQQALSIALNTPEQARTPAQQALVVAFVAEQERQRAEWEQAHASDPRAQEQQAAEAARRAAEAAQAAAEAAAQPGKTALDIAFHTPEQARTAEQQALVVAYAAEQERARNEWVAAREAEIAAQAAREQEQANRFKGPQVSMR